MAIIAILAAIAVPNFLEAQMRAKVGRIKSDLRTVAVGIQSYQVDHNQPPPSNYTSGLGFAHWWVWLKMGNVEGGAGMFLTTPIAYLTTLPLDIFNPSLNGARDNGMVPVDFIGFNYFYFGKEEDGKHLVSCCHGFHPANDPVASELYGDRIYHWSIFSPGPDLAWYLSNKSMIYDPTNGTVSAGDIGYFDAIGLFGG